MHKTLIGLEQVELFRPEEYAGQVELQVGAPAVRRWPPRLCRGFEISLLIGPSHSATIQGRATETPGKVTFVQAPGTAWSAQRAVGAFLSLEIAPELFERFAADWRRCSSLPGPSQIVLPGLLDAFWSSHKVLRCSGDSTARSEALVRLVATVLEQLSGGAPADLVVSDGVAKARDAIHDCPAKAPTISALAALAGLTPFELVRTFRRRYGVTPASYRRLLRVALARKMLARGRTVGEVVAELGFRSASELRQTFVSQVGLTPESYATTGAGLRLCPLT
jgi:AraC-like DNA-binding protein